MSITVRYFSTSSAGAADGTTWNDRAALFSAGNWSSVITGFDFSGANSLECRIGPGTYTDGQNFTSALFTNAPRIAQPLFFTAVDSSGSEWIPPNGAWSSAQPLWSQTGSAEQPILSMSNNAVTIGCAHVHWRGIRFLHSARTGGGVITAAGTLEWFTLENSASNTASVGVDSATVVSMRNGIITMSGTAYSCCAQQATEGQNIRLVGNASASSGNRNGLRLSSNTVYVYDQITVCDHAADGIAQTSTGTSVRLVLTRSTVVTCGGDGMQFDTANVTTPQAVSQCLFANNGGWGINNASTAEVYISDCRFRDNTSGSITGEGNYMASGFGIYTTDAADTEFVDYAGKDFRVASAATIAGRGFGAGQQSASGGASLPIGPSRILRS